MNIAQSYRSLARLCDYPQQREELLEIHDTLSAYLAQNGMGRPTAPYAELLAASTLAELQEDYVMNLDFNPAAAPYLAHHLYGDSQKKGSYLIGVKKEFARYRFEPQGSELPDHLPVLLTFLAHLANQGEDRARRDFIAQFMLDAMAKMSDSPAVQRQPAWQALLLATALLLKADCEEALAC